MANADTPFGLKPVRHLNGNPWNGKARVYYKAAGVAAVFVGDPVELLGSADSTGKYPTVQSLVTDDTPTHIVGVAVAVSNTPYIGANASDLSARYILAASEAYIFVCDDPSVIFEIQEDGVTSTLTADDVGCNCGLTNATGSTTTGISAQELESELGATINTRALRLLRLVDREDNALGAYAKWEVLINLHAYNNAKHEDPTVGV